MTDQNRKESAGDAFREGVRSVAGVLGALVETLEQTFTDLRESNDLSPERAREAARSTVRKAQNTVEELRDRLDFVSRRDFDELREEVRSLRASVDALAARLDVPAEPAADAGASQATGPAGEAEPPQASGSAASGEGRGFPIDEG